MADQDQAAAAVENRRQGWQRRFDPTIVGDIPVGGLRNIEIDTNQHLAGDFDVAELLGHR